MNNNNLRTLGGFSYKSTCWQLPMRLAYEAESLKDEELNKFLDEVLDKYGKRLFISKGKNLVTDQGAQWLCSRFIQSQPTTNWFILFKGTGAVSVNDKAASHAAWSEIHSQYSQTTRPALTLPLITTGRSADNSATLASVSISADVDIYGFGLISSNQKNGTAGILYGVGNYSSARVLVAGNIYRTQTSVTF